MSFFLPFFFFILFSTVYEATDLIIDLNGVDLELIGVYAGSTQRTAEGDSISVSYPFYAGKYPVTQAQWEAVMGSNPSHFKDCGADCPVENISWDDIIDAGGFLDTLNALVGCTGLSGSGDSRYNPEGFPAACFRLPTADESEYLDRAGSSSRFHWGDDDSFVTVDQYAWYGENIERGNSGTRTVGQKLPNAWGIYDSSGNVWEWTYTKIGTNSKVRRGGGGIIMPTPSVLPDEITMHTISEAITSVFD